MSHRNAKKIRKQLKSAGIDCRDAIYDLKEIPAYFVGKELIKMKVRTLKEGCGRKMYQQAKATLGQMV